MSSSASEKETLAPTPNDFLIKAYKTRSGKPCKTRRRFAFSPGTHFCIYNEGHLKHDVPHYFMFPEEELAALEANSSDLADRIEAERQKLVDWLNDNCMTRASSYEYRIKHAKVEVYDSVLEAIRTAKAGGKKA